MIYIPDERTDQGSMAKNVGRPEMRITAESWLLFRWPSCQEPNVAAAETNSLAVILLYYQRTLGRLTGTEVTECPKR
jgi:hypothetical protein